MTLQAYDGGDQVGSIEVQVSVLDINDNRPQFLNASYEVYVPENVLPDAIIATVEAKDDDMNSNVVYGFSAR